MPQDYPASLSFLLSQVGAEVAQRFAADLQAIKLTPREFAVLHLVEQHGSRTQQQLADALGMQRNNMATTADQMQRAGLITRRPHPDDGRALRVELSAEGRRRLTSASAVAPHLDATLADLLSPQQLGQLRRTLTALAAGLDLVPGVHPHLATPQPRARRD